MKKLMFFLMVAIPVLVILIVKLTASVAVGDLFISVQRIEVSTPSVECMVGESVDLSYTIFPQNATNKEVIWSSSNELAATVDMNGHVDFIGIGSGYISAITVDGNMRSQCSFYVWDTKVHEVKLIAPQKFVHLNDTLQLTAQVMPNEAYNKDVIFTSSNEEIAEVDGNGVVTGLQVGYVTIKATSVDGYFSDEVDLAIRKPVSALVVEEKEVVTSSQSIQIEYLVEPDDASDKNVTFKVDNPEVAEVNHLGVLQFKKQGEVNVSITTEDGGFKQVVKYIYTAGYAHDLILGSPTITMLVDSAPVPISYQTIPDYLFQTKVEFVSDDENIADVDANGYIHAVKGGNTVIRVRVKKGEEEGNIIEKQIYVNIESPAKGIYIENGVTAEKVYTLSPKSLPEDSTNTAYFYHILEGENATVTEQGVVIFNSSQPCTAKIKIYANEDESDVSTIVDVTYTAGKASSFQLIDKKLTLNYGQLVTLNYSYLPKNATIRPMTLSIKQNTSQNEGGAIELFDDGRIHAIGGGNAVVDVKFVLYDGRIQEEECEITVLREPSVIEINLDLTYYKGQYITSHNEVLISGNAMPLDATSRDIQWSVNDKNIAFIRDNKLLFNKVGVVSLIATIGELSNSVDVYYVGTNPVYAEVRAVKDGEKIEIPQVIMAGESFEVEISSILPQFDVNPPLSLQATNQKTIHQSGKAIQIDGNKVTGFAGGTATLVIYISNSIRLNYSITVIRKPDSVSVLNVNTQTTAQTVNLISEVLPYDTTNQNVRYEIQESDIASIEGSILTFKKNGVVHITAICEDNEKARYPFYIEKIEKNMVHVLPEQTEITVNKGDLLAFDIDDIKDIQVEKSTPIVENEIVAEKEDKYLRARSAGKATVAVITEQKTYRFEITIRQLVEEIKFTTDLDLIDDEYVTGQDVVDLNFEVKPSHAVDKSISISIIQSISAEGYQENIAYISAGKIYFTKAGEVTIQINSRDENCTSILKMKYTGGDAIDAVLNIEETLLMNIDDVVTIGVSKWIPHDLENDRISFYEVNSSSKKIIEINSIARTIKAVDSGETKLIVELSNGIIKEINIICVNKVKDIQVEEKVLISGDTYTINAVVVPKDATNKTLQYILQSTNIASIQDNVITFTKAGTVTIKVCSTDGTEIEKVVTITSTMGKLARIEIEKNEINLTKGETYRIIADKYPLDATDNKVEQKIISQNAFDGQSQVIELGADGQITALCSGSAVVRIYAYDYEGKEIFADCTITVYSPLSMFELTFDAPLDTYQNQNTFVTSRNEVNFDFVVQPYDANIVSFRCEVASDIARVEDKKIIFTKTGRVAITFICSDSQTEKSKTYSFYYVGDSLIDAILDESNMKNDVITLKAGENFKFTLEKAIPSDNKNLQFTIKDDKESRNDISKQVANFSDGVLYALNGGNYSFTLYVNNIKLGQYNLVVTRDATEIVIDGDEKAYVSDPFYTIVAHVLESDSHQNTLGFISLNTDIANVAPDGNVTFLQFGECQIKIYVQENPDIFKIITVKYTKELQAIKFNKTRDSLYVGGSVDLTVSPMPYNATDFKYTMSIDNESVATLVERGDGYRLIGIAGGSVTVTAKAVGRDDISVSRTFTFYDKITNVKLALDPSGDLDGHGEYRVFGNTFIVDADNLTNTYLMEVSLMPANVSRSLLEWSTSDESVATVDANGLVTFISTGKVTITVSQIVPFEGASVEKDSYTFTIVDGINVSNYEQLKIANGKLTEINNEKKENYTALVLHDNIQLGEEFPFMVFNYNVYGNGFMLDHSKVPSEWYHYVVNKDNIEVDNVILRGTEFVSGAELKKVGNVLTVENCKNVLIYNTILENSQHAMRVQNATAKIDGCILRNCLMVGINVARSEAGASDIVVKDCIFTSTFCGIMYVVDEHENIPDSTVTLEGEVRFYNWSTLEQLEQGLDLDSLLGKYGVSSKMISALVGQVKDVAAEKGKDYEYVYEGKTYYDFGIFRLKATVLSHKFNGAGTYDKSRLNPNCNYSSLTFQGAVNLAIANIPYECSFLSIIAGDKVRDPFIKPGDTYVGNTALLAKIKQPCRF